MKKTDIFLDAFYDTFTLGALFGKLRIPGAPTEIVDQRSTDVQRDEIMLNANPHSLAGIQILVLARRALYARVGRARHWKEVMNPSTPAKASVPNPKTIIEEMHQTVS